MDGNLKNKMINLKKKKNLIKQRSGEECLRKKEECSEESRDLKEKSEGRRRVGDVSVTPNYGVSTPVEQNLGIQRHFISTTSYLYY